MDCDLRARRFSANGITLADFAPLIDGVVPEHAAPEVVEDSITWPLGAGRAVLKIVRGPVLRLHLNLQGWPRDRAIDSLGLRFRSVSGVQRYLRNGYQSWDGSFFVAPGTPAGNGPPGKAPTLGFAVTALVPAAGRGGIVLGFTRHDRFQSRLRFGGNRAAMTLDIETLRDRVPHDGSIEAEPIVLIPAATVEEGLCSWSAMVATESPLPPCPAIRRITGWCSWYNLYAAIDEPVILEHLAAAAAFRDKYRVPLDVFQIDDGFTPEMGDWLEVKPQFPRGMKPLLAEIAAAGFVPGLWIAPFMVGNRSRLYREHPDWVVKDRRTGGPLAQMAFYGEFRWHKRSEEYYILDATHPDALDYIRCVFRTWAQDWGCRYFKTDFMLFGSEHGPDTAVWHEAGLSRIAIWRRMAGLIREEIGDATWLGCGCPLWASVGYLNAVRIGRDIGVSWRGEHSAESLLRDLVTRSHGAGILWQADPDCILLRDRFHELSDMQVRSLALYGGLAGGVLMTSDKLNELSEERAKLLARLLSLDIRECRFPNSERLSPVIMQRVTFADGRDITNQFNVSDQPVTLDDGSTLAPYASQQSSATPFDPL